MSAPARTAAQPAPLVSEGSILQRACACGKGAGPSGRCGSCDSESRYGPRPLQAKSDLLQRQPVTQKKPPPLLIDPKYPLKPLIEDNRARTEDEKYEEAGGKAVEAVLETETGKAVTDALTGALFSTPLSTTTTLGIAAGGIAGLALTHKELPFQIPPVPLGLFKPELDGMSLGVIWKGPVDSPTEAALVFTFEAPAAKKQKQGSSFKDETARMAADQQRFRDSLRVRTEPKGPEASQPPKTEQTADAAAPDTEATASATSLSQRLQFSPFAPLLLGEGLKLELPKAMLPKSEQPPLQEKLAIGASNDPLEHDADRVADQVLANPAADKAPPTIQRLSTRSAGRTGAVPESVHRTLASSGAPLAPDVQTDMASRFGHAFGNVRIHTDASAACSARDIGARAYTVGGNIVFGAGQYAPGTDPGKRLLAHELAHVVQQGAVAPVVQRQPADAPAPTGNRRTGGSASYREATELATCIEIMGDENADYCSREVRGGNPLMGYAAGPAMPAKVNSPATPDAAAATTPARTPDDWAATIREEVKDLLSYGLFDWAIRDKEAVKALGLLGGFPDVELPEQIRLIGQKHVGRLLDNLPEASRSEPAYDRVVKAMGAASVSNFAEEQLSYSLFDWAISDNEAASVFDALSKLPAAEHEAALVDLNKTGKLKRLIANATAAHHQSYIRPWIATLARGRLTDPQKLVLGVIVGACGKDDVETVKAATEARFDVTTNIRTLPNGTQIEWKAESLKIVYQTLDRLPEAHVGRNKEFLHLVQFEEEGETSGNSISTVAGRYNAGAETLSINSKPGDSLVETARHETAHAVDAQLGWSQGAEPAKPQRGGWRRYFSGFENVARDMVAASGGGIGASLDATQRQDVVREMGVAMGKQSASQLAPAIQSLPWFGALKPVVRKDILTDPAFAAVRGGFKVLKPWINAPDGGVHLGDHVYQEGYEKSWNRYRHEARARRVSDYQFRDTGEWFAEAYTFYYAPDPRGKGARLNDKDPDTKTYFDTTVDTLKASR